MTEPLFRADAYARETTARVVAVTGEGGILLDRTVCYAAAGGQPGDRGAIIGSDGREIAIASTVYAADKAGIVHVPASAPIALPAPGAAVTIRLDWETRHRHMRMHTALHLLCALVEFPVTGGQIGAEESRLDFDIPDSGSIDKDTLTAELQRLIAADHPVTTRFIADAELDANPGLVRTMSVKPPTGTGRVRLVAIGADGSIDLQPCGGTHVARTGEIGGVAVTRIEKKGKLNRRIRVALISPSH